MMLSTVALLFAMQAVPVAAAAPPPAAAEQSFDGVDWDKEFGVTPRVRDPVTGELPVDSYVRSNANAGTSPLAGTATADAFGGQPGIRRVVDRLVDLNTSDPRIKDIFVNHDMVRLRRTLFEQFCYLLGAGCDYSGRNMADSHKGLGTRRADLNALVENLQAAMRAEMVPFQAQNRLLAKLAAMERDVVDR